MSRSRTGFTLLELSIVLVIIAVVMAGGAITFSSMFQQRQFDETNAKLAILQKALLDYRRTFKRLPCPAEIDDYNMDERYFGIEAQNATGCNGTPAATFTYNITTGTSTACTAAQHCIYGGMIPTRTLKLADEMAIDGWGRRIFYAVDSDFAKTDAFTTQMDITADATSGTTRIVVKSISGDDKTISAAYALVSFGPDGHGAYPRYVSEVSLTTASRINQVGTYQIASNETPIYHFPGATASDWNVSAVSVPMYVMAAGGDPGIGVGGGGSETSTTITFTARLSSGSGSVYTLENCDCASTGQNATFDNVFYQARLIRNDDPADTFDDLLAFATRGSLRSATE